MKIVIVVYSETRNTYSVVEKIQARFHEDGHNVNIIELLVHDVKNNKKLSSIPEIPTCDLLVFASPVQAFSVAVPMQEYMKNMNIPLNQKVNLLITQHFKKRWLGGNRALKQMRKYLSRFQANIEKEVDIHWSRNDRKTQIEAALKELSF